MPTEAYVPEPADPCPCRSGATYAACCAPDAERVEEAMNLCEEGSFEDALTLLAGGSVELMGRRATVLRLLGRALESDALVAAALARNPDYPRGLYLRASSAAERGDHAAAARDLERCERLLPPADSARRAEALTNLGVALFNAGDRDGAREAWRRALALEPDDELARLNLLALARDGAGGRDRVAAEFAVEETGDSLVLSNERRVAALFEKAVEAQKGGRHEEAVGLYEEILELDPVAADALLNLGLASLEIGDRRGARAALERFVALEPRSREARRIAKLLARLKKKK